MKTSPIGLIPYSVYISTLIYLAACGSSPPPAPPPAPAPPPTSTAPAPAPAPVAAPETSAARTVDEYKRQAVQRLLQANRVWVHNERPQALLRAVMVVRMRVDGTGRARPEFMRSNGDRELEQRVLQSIANAAPFPAPPRALAAPLARDGFVESFLFNTDGRFTVHTFALPQKTE